MAYTHASKFVDVTSIDMLNRRLARVPAEAAKQVSKRNRQHANSLVKLIKAEMPVAGGTVKHRHSWSHETGLSRRGPGGSGKLRRSIRSRVSSDYANVLGGNAATPYFIVNEFGGGARFVNGKGNKVYIPVRKRSPSIKSLGLFDKSNKQRGAAGWFFWPTAREYAPWIQTAIVRDAEGIVRRELAGRLGT